MQLNCERRQGGNGDPYLRNLSLICSSGLHFNLSFKPYRPSHFGAGGLICWGQSTDQVFTLGINLRIYSGNAPTWNKCVTMSTSDSPPMTGFIVIKCTYKLPSVMCHMCHPIRGKRLNYNAEDDSRIALDPP